MDGAQNEALPIRFGTSYFRQEGDGTELIVAKTGSVATAISRSINNPYIFVGTNLDFIDPGVDRIAAVPIEEAYIAFTPDRIVAVNTTGSLAVYSDAVRCPVDEILVPRSEGIDFENALRGHDPDFAILYEAGVDAVGRYFTDEGDQ